MIGIIIFFILATQFTSIVLIPSYETVMAAVQTPSPSIPYTKTKRNEWNEERKRLEEERRNLLEEANVDINELE